MNPRDYNRVVPDVDPPKLGDALREGLEYTDPDPQGTRRQIVRAVQMGQREEIEAEPGGQDESRRGRGFLACAIIVLAAAFVMGVYGSEIAVWVVDRLEAWGW